MTGTPSKLYASDFYAWANEQAALLRAGQVAAADLDHIAEEIESMGKTEKRELVSRLTILLLQLLKWQFQSERRSASWESTIAVQRDDIADHLDDNPSLKAMLDQAMTAAYRKAVLMAVGETGLPKTTFPADCPWSFQQSMDSAFRPE